MTLTEEATRTTLEDDVQPVLIVTTESVPRYQAVETRGEMFGLVVRSRRCEAIRPCTS
jgi:hypothetical protein